MDYDKEEREVGNYNGNRFEIELPGRWVEVYVRCSESLDESGFRLMLAGNG